MRDDPDDFCRLWLLCHPELDAAHAAVAVGAGAAELGRRGRSQVVRWLELLADLALHEIWSGPQPQCLGPARALAELRQREVRADARLRGQDLGAWQGRPWQDLAREHDGALLAFFAAFGEVRAPGGESLGDAVERTLAWWTEVMPASAGKALCVVMPGALLGGFAAALLGMRLSRSPSLHLPPGGIGVLEVYQNGARIGCWHADALQSAAGQAPPQSSG